MNKKLLRVLGVLGACGLGLLAACDVPDGDLQYGGIEMTTSAPLAEKEFTTADGWVIKYETFLVNLASVNVLRTVDSVLAAYAGPLIVNQVDAPPKTVLSATVRRAGLWDDVNFTVGPVAFDEEVLAGLQTAVDEASTPEDKAAAQAEVDKYNAMKDGFSILVVGTATKGAVVKKFTWGFATDTLYSACEGEVNGQTVPGVLIPVDGNDTPDIVMRGDVFFSDALDGSGALRFDPIAAADADNNGVVTLEELTAVPLASVRLGPGLAMAYAADDAAIPDLGAYVTTLTSSIVASYRAKGQCTAAPVAAE